MKITASSFTFSVIAMAAFSAWSSPAWGLDVTINPPPSLTLDGIMVETGTFNLTGATGLSVAGSSIVPTQILNQADDFDDVIIDAIIGDLGTQILLTELDHGFQGIRLQGFFDAITPQDLSPAEFDITLLGLTGDGTGDFTYFLPVNTGPISIFQVTNVGSSSGLSDNTNWFLNSAPNLVVIGGNITPLETSLVGDSVGNFCPAPSIGVTFHGSGGGVSPTPCVVGNGEKVPEPLTIFGTLAAFGVGAAVKRRSLS